MSIAHRGYLKNNLADIGYKAAVTSLLPPDTGHVNDLATKNAATASTVVNVLATEIESHGEYRRYRIYKQIPGACPPRVPVEEYYFPGTCRISFILKFGNKLRVVVGVGRALSRS